MPLDGHQRSRSPVHGLAPLQQVGHLNVASLALPRGDEVDFRFPRRISRAKPPRTPRVPASRLCVFARDSFFLGCGHGPRWEKCGLTARQGQCLPEAEGVRARQAAGEAPGSAVADHG